MGIITVLCKGFILLCSMHKNVLSLMISSSVLFTYLFKGNRVTLGLVDAGSALTCSASLSRYEITPRTRTSPPAYLTPHGLHLVPLGFSPALPLWPNKSWHRACLQPPFPRKWLTHLLPRTRWLFLSVQEADTVTGMTSALQVMLLAPKLMNSAFLNGINK